MTTPRTTKTRTIGAIASAAITSLAAASWAQQQQQGSVLQQLDRETRELYAALQGSVVRVAMPPPRWVNEVAATGNPLEKWRGQLDPAVRKKLEEHDALAKAGEFHQVNAAVTTPGAATQPATLPAVPTIPASVALSGTQPQPQMTSGGSVTVLAPVRVGDQVQIRQVRITFSNHVGVIVDEQGHVLVPLYVEREAVDQQRGLEVMLGTGKIVKARFVGSDRMMNLTVLQLDEPAGKPVRTASGKPAQGELVMIVSPATPAVARLVVWTGGHQEMGLVADAGGGVLGFARLGHFLQMDDAAPVVKQLVETGEIKRATLGVWVEEVNPQDALRQQVTTLGSRPALKVIQVTPGSAAAQAGLVANDLILSLSGGEVGDTTSFAIAISKSSGPTELKVIRGNREQTVRVDLKPR